MLVVLKWKINRILCGNPEIRESVGVSPFKHLKPINMLHTVRLVPRSYMPDDLEIGMYFFTDRIIQLDKVPANKEQFIDEYGYPVEFYIIDEDPNQRWTNILATPNQIGWFDFDPEGEDYAEMSLEHLNLIALEYDGWCQIDVWHNHIDDEETHDDYIKIMPELLEGKVVIHTVDYEGEDDDDYEDGWDEEDEDWEEYEETDLDDDTWKE